MDVEIAKDSKKKQKKKKQEEKSIKSKGESKDIMEIEDEDIKKPKEKQTLLTEFSKKEKWINYHTDCCPCRGFYILINSNINSNSEFIIVFANIFSLIKF